MVTVGFPSLVVLEVTGREVTREFWSLGLKFKKNLSISPKPVDKHKCLKSLEKIFSFVFKRLAQRGGGGGCSLGGLYSVSH